MNPLVKKVAYTKNNVYALNLKRSEGVNDNLVQFAPTGNIVDGVHYYEEGTDVKLTAINNRILTFTGWEGDATGTEQECELKMDGEKSVTANFSAADYRGLGSLLRSAFERPRRRLQGRIRQCRYALSAQCRWYDHQLAYPWHQQRTGERQVCRPHLEVSL